MEKMKIAYYTWQNKTRIYKLVNMAKDVSNILHMEKYTKDMVTTLYILLHMLIHGIYAIIISW